MIRILVVFFLAVRGATGFSSSSTQGVWPRLVAKHATTEEIVAAIKDIGPDGLCSELYSIIEGFPPIRGLADEDHPRLLSMLQSAGMPEDSYTMSALKKEILPEISCTWEVAVKKWRQKALAVEKYRCTYPQAVAGVYTFMANTCLMRGRGSVAYEALSYSGIVPAGPSYVSRRVLRNGEQAVILDLDRKTIFIAEQILDYDLNRWRKLAGATTTATSSQVVGVEESNFWQNDDAFTHTAALRIRDVVLASMRVALRHMIWSNDEFASCQKLIVLAGGCTKQSEGLDEIVCPKEAVERILWIDAELVCLSPQECSSLRDDLGEDAERGCPIVVNLS